MVKKYQPQSRFIVCDNDLVYSTKPVIWAGSPTRENDVTVQIAGRELTEEQKAEISKVICDVLNKEFKPNHK